MQFGFKRRHWLVRRLFSFKGVCAMAFVLIVGTTTVLEYTHESDMTAKVISINTQQHAQGDKDGFFTSYKYLVATDKGTLEISANGLMASSKFGTLQEGKTYRFHLRGYSIPFIGLYPYIIEAKECGVHLSKLEQEEWMEEMGMTVNE